MAGHPPERPPEDEYDWRQEAECYGTFDSRFFPERGESTHEAKRICRVCEVSEYCLEYALVTNSLSGIWGETTPRTRAAIRKKRKWRRNGDGSEQEAD